MNVQLKSVSFSYKAGNGRREILKDFSLDIVSGELVVILGPSGCGKSTLLNIIGGLLQPENGQVILDDVSYYQLTKRERDSFRRNNIGYIFQNFYLVEDLSPTDNILLAMKNNKSSKEKKESVKTILEEVGIEHKIDSKISTFSGGEQQRLAIARAMAQDSKLLICDEPTGSLDEENAIQIMDILKSLSEKGKTVIVVTHNRQLCSYATKVLELTTDMKLGRK